MVNVSDGYARNFILPKKLGLEANAKNLNDLKLQKAAEEKRQKEILEEARALGKELESKTLEVKIKTGEGGRTFGSISSKEITQELKSQYALDIDKKKLQINDPIKTLGTHTVPVKLHPQVTAELKVKVSEL
ncbi:LSU ribosomal protein L9P [Anaerocolumna jejuensis DSM 15929]|uniref:Large ribosomal subunit protein bL9 n=2 Tax=Anaerocolumna TaxID=1843210 RepID=A0A1M6V1A1_9FIRM|nr:LSU ribosomal protein L9P [Anaerocolumna jejuensis DSM 15929]